MREPSTEYDNLTADELLDVVRKTWIDYDLKSAIETAPPDDDYIAAHIIDVAVYATPAIPRPLAELAEARERIRELEAENRHMEMTLIWIWVTTRDPIIEARLINEYPSIAEKGTADSPQP